MSHQPLDYETQRPVKRLARRLPLVIAVSAFLGMIWNIGAGFLMDRNLLDAFRPSWLIAGLVAGIVAGLFTVWSRLRRRGRESFWLVTCNYYLGIFVYWLVFLVTERVRMCVESGGWTDFDLHDHVKLLAVFALFGTLPHGLFLLPLSFVSRQVVWRVYSDRAVT
jgi:hypothetical protein